jgi:hypothetical protein
LDFSSLGVEEVLRETFGTNIATRVKTVVSYMLAEGNIMSDLNDYCEENILSGAMTDKEASRLFASINSIERMGFFKR